MARQLLRAGTSSVLIAYGVSASGKTHTIEACMPHLLQALNVLTDKGCCRCMHAAVLAIFRNAMQHGGVLGLCRAPGRTQACCRRRCT